VADPAALHANVQLYTVEFYRAWLATRDEEFLQGFEVDVVEPDDGDFPDRLLVILDNGGTQTSLTTCEHSLGVKVLAGSKRNPTVAENAARAIYAVRTLIPSADPANPIAAILGGTPPVPITEEQDRASRYATVTVSDVATAL
jgi:hypothetical protein